MRKTKTTHISRMKGQMGLFWVARKKVHAIITLSIVVFFVTASHLE
jgi:hypothetical protein